MSISAAKQSSSERLPAVGDLVRVRSRLWLVEEVVRPEQPRQSLIVRLTCSNDDAKGQGRMILHNQIRIEAKNAN